MSFSQIEQFSNRVKNDPAMFNKLMSDIQTPDEFIDRAVMIGAEAGFSFSRDDADAWINKQIKAKENGELSDLQLEGVAGGKTTPGSILDSVENAIASPFIPIYNATVIPAAKLAGNVVNWFQSW